MRRADTAMVSAWCLLLCVACLPRTGVSQETASWPTYMTQDSLVLRVPQGYERQEGTSIFDLKASDAPKEFVIGASFTVKRVPTASLTHDHFKASAPSAHD